MTEQHIGDLILIVPAGALVAAITLIIYLLRRRGNGPKGR